MRERERERDRKRGKTQTATVSYQGFSLTSKHFDLPAMDLQTSNNFQRWFRKIPINQFQWPLLDGAQAETPPAPRGHSMSVDGHTFPFRPASSKMWCTQAHVSNFFCLIHFSKCFPRRLNNRLGRWGKKEFGSDQALSKLWGLNRSVFKSTVASLSSLVVFFSILHTRWSPGLVPMIPLTWTQLSISNPLLERCKWDHWAKKARRSANVSNGDQ